MLSWLIIAALIVVVLVVLKFKEFRHKFGFLLILVILLLFAGSAISVYRNQHVDLSTFDGVVAAGKIYTTWLGGVFTNVKGITGYAVSQDWTSKNDTVSNAGKITTQKK